MRAKRNARRAVTGVMLVGGGSIRFGEADKALANVGGRTMIKRAIDVVEAATNGLPIVAVRTAEQREHYKTALSDRDVRFTVDDLEFEGPLAGVLGAIDAIDDPVHMRVRQPLLLAAAIVWLADQSRRRDGAVHSVQRRNANNHDVFAIKQLNGETTGLRVFDRRLAVDQVHDDLPATAVCGRYSMNSTMSRSSPRKRRRERSGTRMKISRT